MKEITSIFSEKDKNFNREMISKGNQETLEKDITEHSPFQPRNYDFTSEVLEDYREKWNMN